MDEFSLIKRFFKHRSPRRDDVRLGIGDDAAVIDSRAGDGLVVTTDVLVAGVHFPEATEAAAVGYKALSVNLSDIAAMGATPAWVSLGLTLPDTDESWLEGFCTGFFSLAEQHGVQLIGGDTTHGPLCIAVQVIGLVGEQGYLSRGGARENDIVYVSGTLGDAALGWQVLSDILMVPGPDEAYFEDRLNRPAPRVALGRALAPHASAAIDISDGLAADLGHICESSGVGALIDVARLPVSEPYRRCLPKVGWEPALGFGDDYELCFTVPPDRTSAIERLSGDLELALTPIGRITGEELRWVYNDEPFALHEQGYRHFR